MVRYSYARFHLGSTWHLWTRKYHVFNNLLDLSIGLSSGTSSNDLIVVETTGREIRFFNKDGLHLNKHKRCTALAGSILKCLYSVLRPLCKMDKRRHNP